MNHKFRFSTSGNPTKHIPISYWSLWGQPRSVTSGDLSWPWNLYHAMSRVTASHALTPITSTIPIQVNRTTPSCVFSRFRWNLVEGCSSYYVITSWPDLTWPVFFLPKVAQKMPHKLWKVPARYSKWCCVQLRKTHVGLHQPPFHWRGGIPRQISPGLTPSSLRLWKFVHGVILGSEDDCYNFRPLRANF